MRSSASDSRRAPTSHAYVHLQALKALAANSAANGKVLFSMSMVKINRKGKGQNRVLLITSRHLLNLMPDNYAKCNRCVQIAQLHHVTTSTTTEEFVVHFTDEYDYRFKSPYAPKAVQVLQEAYLNMTGGALSVVTMSDVDGLAAQVMTKASVKRVGSSWGPAMFSTKEPAKQPSTSALPLPSSKDDDDANDSDEDGLGELPSARGLGGAVAGGAGAIDVSDGTSTPSPMTAGGAFGGKSKYTIDDFTVMKVLGKGAFGKVMLAKAKVCVLHAYTGGRTPSTNYARTRASRTVRRTLV